MDEESVIKKARVAKKVIYILIDKYINYFFD